MPLASPSRRASSIKLVWIGGSDHLPTARTRAHPRRAAPPRAHGGDHARGGAARRGCARVRAVGRWSDPPIHTNLIDDARREGDARGMDERDLIYDWNAGEG